MASAEPREEAALEVATVAEGKEERSSLAEGREEKAPRKEEEKAPAGGVSERQILKAAKLIAGGKVVAFTGAGVSAESGVPTYRDPGGLWMKYDMKKVSEIKSFLKNPLACWSFELELFKLLKNVKPNAGHKALAELEEAGLLTGVVTQNVEGLHQAAGSQNVVELHGNETQAVCLRCKHRLPATDVFRQLGWLDEAGDILEAAAPDVSAILRQPEGGVSDSSSSELVPLVAPPLLLQRPKAAAGSAASRSSSSATSSSSEEEDATEPWRGDKAPLPPAGAPICPACGKGLLKPDAVYFGERLDREILRKAEKLFKGGRVALVVGSTCKVAPASTLPVLLGARGGSIIDVNPNGSRISKSADCWLQGPSAEVLPRLMEAVAELGRKYGRS